MLSLEIFLSRIFSPLSGQIQSRAWGWVLIRVPLFYIYTVMNRVRGRCLKCCFNLDSCLNNPHWQVLAKILPQNHLSLKISPDRQTSEFQKETTCLNDCFCVYDSVLIDSGRALLRVLNKEKAPVLWILMYIHILISRWKNSSKKRGRVSVSDEDGLAVCCAGPVLAL